MKNAYPIILTPAKEGGYVVYIPDFDVNTEGKSESDAMEMARDAIGMLGIDLEDDGEDLPTPGRLAELSTKPGDIVTLVDVDFTEYRRRTDTRAVRKNVSLPAWMSYQADQRGLNCSQILQDALRKILA